jgi:hypothetical protein
MAPEPMPGHGETASGEGPAEAAYDQAHAHVLALFRAYRGPFALVTLEEDGRAAVHAAYYGPTDAPRSETREWLAFAAAALVEGAAGMQQGGTL